MPEDPRSRLTSYRDAVSAIPERHCDRDLRLGYCPSMDDAAWTVERHLVGRTQGVRDLSLDALDDEFTSWLLEAYAVGAGAHLGPG